MKISNKVWLYFSGAAMLLSACTKDFQEINKTPGLPTTAEIGPLANGVIKTLLLGGQEQAAIHNEWYYPVTQLGVVSGSSGYLVQNGANDVWTSYYNALQNLNVMQDQIDNYKGDKEEMNNVQAITSILRAYKTFRMTDQFGDIPYFSAGLAYTNSSKEFRPAYDSQERIYDSLLADLKWAAEHIKPANATTAAGRPYQSLGSSETLFHGDMSKWQKFANALILRHAMQMVEESAAKATPYLQYALSGVPLPEEGEELGMWPKDLGGLELKDSRYWSFSSHKFLRLSSTVWKLMADANSEAGIFDPRARLFFETNQAGQWAALQIGSNAPDATNPYSDQRDKDPLNKDHSVFSSFNFYLVRDVWYQPELFITPAEVQFLKAEAYARGLGVAKNNALAEAAYYAGIRASVNFWFKIAHNTNVLNDNWAAVAPASPTVGEMNTFLANPKVVFTGTDDQLLNKIYAQEWLSYFRQPWLAYNLWRRTGRTPRDGDPVQYKDFNRLQYPEKESIDNSMNFKTQVDAMGGNSTNVKVWWMK